MCHPWLPLIYTFTFLLVTMQIILNLESNIKTIIWFSPPSNPWKNEMKGRKHPTFFASCGSWICYFCIIYFLRLANLLGTTTLINLSPTSCVLKMTYCNTCLRSHCLQLWFRTHLVTIDDNIFGISSQVAQLLGNETKLWNAIVCQL